MKKIIYCLKKHHILSTSIFLLFYMYMEFIFILPEWYLIHAFSWKKETLNNIVEMRYTDQNTYGKSCCYIFLESSGEVRMDKHWIDESLPEALRNDYAALLRDAGLRIMNGMYGTNDIVNLTIDMNYAGETVSYLYSKHELKDCTKDIFEISGGLPAQKCIPLDKYWYLLYVIH